MGDSTDGLLRHLVGTGSAFMALGIATYAWILWGVIRGPCDDGCKGGAFVLILLGIVVGAGVIQVATGARLWGRPIAWLRPVTLVFGLVVLVVGFPFTVVLLPLVPALLQLLNPTRPLSWFWLLLRFPLAGLAILMVPLLGLALYDLRRDLGAALFWILVSLSIGSSTALAWLGLRAARQLPGLTAETPTSEGDS